MSQAHRIKQIIKELTVKTKILLIQFFKTWAVDLGRWQKTTKLREKWYPRFIFLPDSAVFELDCRTEVAVAATMLRRPVPTNERVQTTTLGITAAEILQSTRGTLLLLLRTRLYVWRNHVATSFLLSQVRDDFNGGFQ